MNRANGIVASSVVFIRSLIPWLKSAVEIIDYMLMLSVDQEDRMLQQTLRHFFAAKDDSSSSLRCDIKDETLEISRVFPNLPHRDIRNRLLVLGDIPNRKEVVLRQLLQRENHNAMTSTSKQNHCNSNNETTNFNIKIKKMDGELKIVPNGLHTIEALRVRPVEPTTTPKVTPKAINIDSNPPSGDIGFYDNYQSSSQWLYPEQVGMLKEQPSVEESHAYMDYIFQKDSDLMKSFQEKHPPFPEPVPMDSFEPMEIKDNDLGQENDPIPFEHRIREILGWEDQNIVPPKISTSVEHTVRSDSSETIIQDINDGVDVVIGSPLSPSTLSPNGYDSSSSSTTTTNSSRVDDMSSLSSDYDSPPVPFRLIPGTRFALPIRMETNVNNDRKRKADIIDMTSTYEGAGPSTVGAPAAPVSPSPPKLKKVSEYDPTLTSRLSEMFPETCIDYIRRLCEGKQWNQFEGLVETMLEDPNRPQREIKQRVVSPSPKISNEDQLKIVKAILPDADPTFLEIQCEKLNYNPEAITQFVGECQESKKYPTMKEYLRKQKLSAQFKQYTDEFSVEKFVELFPNPEETFSDPKRNVQLDEYSKRYLKVFFENKFNKLTKRAIAKALSDNDHKVLRIDAYLARLMKKNLTMKSKRKTEPIQRTEQNIPLLQELAYLTHKDDILYYIEMKKKQIIEKREYARANGLLNTCSCCFGDDVLPEDTYYCPKEHPFCGDCIKTSCGIALGEGRTEFKCLAECNEDFPMSLLQKVLEPKMFSNLARKQALAEIKAASLDNLEICPFCDFASIPNPQDKIFRCLNPECMKESCRECKEQSHLPLRCDEIEKDEHVKARTHIENKMTEALLRKCYKCGTSFFKEEGCNKMTCPCGAAMCYICNKPVDNYKHFNGLGGDQFNLCPLYSDTNELNKVKVLQAAQVAKEEVGSELKVDPTTDIEKHFEQRKQKVGVPPYLNLLEHHPLPPRDDRQVVRRRRQRMRNAERQAWMLINNMRPH